MAGIINDREAIVYVAQLKMVELGQIAAERRMEGKHSPKQIDQGIKILNLLEAIDYYADLTDDEVETILYSLKDLGEVTVLPTMIPPVIGQPPTYLLSPPSAGGASTGEPFVTVSLTSGLENERNLSAGNGLQITDNGPNSSIEVNLKKTTVTVASASLRGCGSSPVVILVAGGANKYHSITKAVLSYKAGGTAFDFTSELVLKSVGGDVQFLISGDLNTTNSANFDLIKQGQKNVTNAAYVLTTADGSNATVGNGDIDITLYFSIEDTNT